MDKNIKKIYESRRGYCSICNCIINTHKKGNYKRICDECNKKRTKAREKIRRNNPERKEYNRKISKQCRLKLRFQILERDNFTCQYCGKKPPEVVLEVDHIYPKSKGGLNKLENYKTACRDCNLGKGDSILQENIKNKKKWKQK